MTFVSSERPKKTLPPPFERPKIEISAAGRSWQWVHPIDIKVNDIIPDFGLIQDRVTTWYIDPATLEQVTKVKLVGLGKTDTFDNSEKIFAFTRTPT